MALDIDDVVGSVVIERVATQNAPVAAGVLQVPVSGEIDYAHSAGLAVVGFVVSVALQQGVVAARLRTLAAVGRVLLQAQFLVGERGRVGALIHLHALPVGRVVVPLVEQRRVALPRVEVGRQRRLAAVGRLAEARTHLGEHEERATIQSLALVLLAQSLKGRNEHLVERQAADVAAGVDAEAVHTHLDERAVAVNEVFDRLGILGVEVHAVAGNLRPPAVGLVPVEVAVVVPQVVGVVVHAVGILHFSKAVGILFAAGQTQVVVLQFAALTDSVWHHALVDVALGFSPVARKEFAQVLLTKVARVVNHDVEDNLHAARVGRVNQVLELGVVALKTLVNLAEVHGVVAVVVKAAGVLHHRCHPHRRETQRLDVVEFLDKALEVAAPLRILILDVLGAVPTVGVVTLVAVIETGRHHEVDGLVAEVHAVAHHGGKSRHDGCHGHNKSHHLLDETFCSHKNCLMVSKIVNFLVANLLIN